MIKKEDAQIDIDRTTAIVLHNIDPDTRTRLVRVSDFLQKHLELAGISYVSVELLIAEKNINVRNAAIKRISAEIMRRRDVSARKFRLQYRKVTESQVRKILHEERIKENPNIKTRKLQNAEITLECPFCKKNITYKKSARNNILSFRATEVTDDTVTQLSKAFNVSRSYFVQELLKVERKYGKNL
jgi:hypothetical protein